MNGLVSSEGRSDGIENMRRDGDLLDVAEKGAIGCRVYSWDGPWVTLGRFQSPDRDLINPTETQWIIRPTGGKAVLHGHDVTVGLAVPLNCLSGVDSRSIKSVYRAVVSPIVSALQACGVPAELAEYTRYARSGRHTADCFAFSSPNDVVDSQTGKKVCGCALRLTQNAVLVQASIPKGRPLVDPRQIIVNADRSNASDWDDANFVLGLEIALAELWKVRAQ